MQIYIEIIFRTLSGAYRSWKLSNRCYRKGKTDNSCQSNYLHITMHSTQSGILFYYFCLLIQCLWKNAYIVTHVPRSDVGNILVYFW